MLLRANAITITIPHPTRAGLSHTTRDSDLAAQHQESKKNYLFHSLIIKQNQIFINLSDF